MAASALLARRDDGAWTGAARCGLAWLVLEVTCAALNALHGYV
jgi:hypothetical protein